MLAPSCVSFFPHPSSCTHVALGLFSCPPLPQLFGDLFGGFGGDNRAGRRGGVPRSRVRVDLQLSFREAALGCTKTLAFNLPTRCKECGTLPSSLQVAHALFFLLKPTTAGKEASFTSALFTVLAIHSLFIFLLPPMQTAAAQRRAQSLKPARTAPGQEW